MHKLQQCIDVYRKIRFLFLSRFYVFLTFLKIFSNIFIEIPSEKQKIVTTFLFH